MKLSRLFVLTALWLTGLGVNAAELQDREAPVAPDTTPLLDGVEIDRTPAAFEVGKMYALYNVGSDKFFTEGNNWGTRASVGPTPLLVYFSLPEGKSLNDATFLLNDYSSNRTGWKNAFFDSETAMFVDRGSQANLYWNVIDQGGLVYRLQASPSNPSLNPTNHPGFVGRDDAVEQDASNYSGDNEGRMPLSPFLEEGEGHHLDWQFFAVTGFEDWEAYFEEKAVFDKAEALKKVIQDAEEKGVDASAAINVYNDLTSTIEQLQSAAETLSKAITEGTFSGFTPGTALDVTSLIVNPDFAGDDLSGWSGSGWGSYGPKENAERFSMTFDTYQDIAGLKAGLYVAGVNAFYRAGNAATAYTNFKAQNEDSKNAKFYVTAGENTLTADIVSPYEGAPTAGQGKGSESSAKDEETGITYYIPNNMEAAEYYMHTLGLYRNPLFFETTGGQIRLGLKKDVTVTDDWVICDDFTLIYCGEGAEAYKAYVEYYRDHSFPDYEALRVEAADPFTTTDGINFTDSYLTAFKNTSVNATDEASARAAMETLNAAFEPLKLNVALWSEFLNTAKKAAAVGDDASLDQSVTVVAETGDWGKYLAAEEWNAHEMTNEELRAKIDEMEANIKEAKNHPIHSDFETVQTQLLTNPDFEDGANGWTIEKVSGGNVVHGGNSKNHCFEGWNNANYNIYQVVKGAPEGVYRIEVQGFYRYGRGRYADYKAQEASFVKPGGAPVFVYMNNKQTPFTNIYGDERQIDDAAFYGSGYEDVPIDEEGNQVSAGEAVSHLYFPNDMASAATAFGAGMYKQSAYGIIRAGQDMKIGVKGNSTQLGDSWCIWDNFRLFNCGKSVDALNEVLPDEIANATSMLTNEDGSDKLMGKDIHNALLTAIANAEAVLGTTGDAMFDALNNLFDAEENVNASVELFNSLLAANDKLMKALENYSDSPAADEAGELYEEIRASLGEFSYNDSDVPGLIQDIKAMMTKLRMPAAEEYANASVENPVQFEIIENAEYDSDGAGIASSDGWEGTAAGTNGDVFNAELFNKETFDHYQEFVGLPAGLYQVQVTGFYRAGLADNDYTLFNENPESDNNALLYATGANTQSVALKRLASFASDVHAGEDDWAEVAEGAGLYVPNMMSTASVLFEENDDALVNTVNVIVGKDGALRIGLKKDVAIASDWCLFDDWKLFYLGEADAPVQGDVNGDGKVDVADISAILNHMAGTQSYPSTGDVNGDGTVDVADISKVLDIMASQARAKGVVIDEE